MESLIRIVSSKSLRASGGTEKITSDSSGEERREALYYILTEYREAKQFQPLTVEEMEIRIAAWLPVTAPIPADRLRDCYAWAMQNRVSQFPLAADELVDAWKHLQHRAETEGTSELRDDRLLPERAAEGCARCWKRRDALGRLIECLEISPVDGSIGGPCDHRPLTEAEKRQAEETRAGMLAEAQRQARERLKLRREQEAQEKEDAEKPKDHHLFCSRCKRRVSTLSGWQAGETCGALLSDENAQCPKCQQPHCVLNLGKRTCRNCFATFEVVTCDGVMESAVVKAT